jgi:diaminopimelate decarboxylase
MASQYNSRPRPASVVVSGNSARVSRRRESIADVTAVESEESGLAEFDPEGSR